MDNQKSLFGVKDMQPKMNLKKIITKERLKEIQGYLDKRDGLSAEQKLREMRYELENMERRISHKR